MEQNNLTSLAELNKLVETRTTDIQKRKSMYEFVAFGLNSNSKLENCEKQSLVNALYIINELGLSLVNQEAYIIPYDKKAYKNGRWEIVSTVAQLQIAYKGMVKILRDAQFIKNWTILEVTEKHTWDSENLTFIDRSNPLAENQNRKVIGYFVRAVLSNNDIEYIARTKKEMEAWATKYSNDYRSNKEKSIWGQQFTQMALKTITKEMIRKIMKNPAVSSFHQEKLETINKYDQSAIAGEDNQTPNYIDNQPMDIESVITEAQEIAEGSTTSEISVAALIETVNDRSLLVSLAEKNNIDLSQNSDIIRKFIIAFKKKYQSEDK